MIKKVFRIIIALFGISLGYVLAELIVRAEIIRFSNNIINYSFYGVLIILFGGIFYLIAPRLMTKIENIVDRIENQVLKQPKEDILIGSLGVIFGIIIASLISLPLTMLNLPNILEYIVTVIIIAIYLASVTLMLRLVMKNKEEISRFIYRRRQKYKNVEGEKTSGEILVKKDKRLKNSYSKVLDTSVIIDGRIQQIAKTGFIDGDLIIPNFVLEELQLIADSADEIKRERGRRGLDIVKDLQDLDKINLTITKKDYKDTKEVDIKLLKYALETGSSIITNDFNLNKLAVVQGIKVLNINDLANSVKTVVIPGEKMIINIIKEGREKNQGLAYLDDGTMIVVEEAKHLIGKTVEVVVSTVLQTAAGKMIFTKVINS